MTITKLKNIKKFDDKSVKAQITVRDFISQDSGILRYEGNRDEARRVLNGEAEHCKDITVFNTNISLLHYTGREMLEFAIFYKTERDSSGKLKSVDTVDPTKVTHGNNDIFVIDGNTRRFAWNLMNEKGLLTEEQLDTILDVNIMEVSTSDEVRKCYEMFDTKASLKSNKHTMESVAAQVGLGSKNLSTLKTALNLVGHKLGKGRVAKLKIELGTEVAAYEHLVGIFGKHHIRDFANMHKGLTGKTTLTGMSPHIVAYRKLREDYGKDYHSVIDSVFESWFKKEFDPKKTITGNAAKWDWMCDVTTKFCNFNPKGATMRINILAPTLIFGMRAKIDGDDKILQRLPFRDNEEGVLSLLGKVNIV